VSESGVGYVARRRFTRETRIAPRIVGKSSKWTCDFDVLRYPIRTQPPVPFKGIFLPQCSYVECHAASSTRLQLRSFPGILNEFRGSGKGPLLGNASGRLFYFGIYDPQYGTLR
jgi:hypothetical protein